MKENTNIMWGNMAKMVEIVDKETLGSKKGFGSRDKETWWWNEDVQEKVRNKIVLKSSICVIVLKIGKSFAWLKMMLRRQ